ncbi:hypothetical protein DNTS_031293 [Danionella cerebrum]|uniref:Interferon regulatory factor n=1 Tax=Danionella cerebrum TaxID=2873325 RepID=A0A553Q5Y4_9TELE|nr:hypothetical protein DNTS_031293 [Danionella translucida]
MPVDRMRMRPWLEQQINSGEIQGLHWVNEERKIFQIPWMHAARHGWDLEKDAPLFMKWAIHTGKYCPGIDKPDPKTWKANFRCAMNSLPDIEEVKDKSIKKGTNAFRMYRMLSSSERVSKKGKKKLDLEQKAKLSFQKRKAGIPKKNHWIRELSIKEDITPDSTVISELEICHKKEISGVYPPEICAVVEVATEQEEPALPQLLQDSRVSSYSDSDTESLYSEQDTEQLPQDLSLKSSQSSVLRIHSAEQSTPSTTLTSAETNFKIISYREESPLIPYNTLPWFSCQFNFTEERESNFPSSSNSRASAKAVDLSVAKR